jgi:hypothetical protein
MNQAINTIENKLGMQQPMQVGSGAGNVLSGVGAINSLSTNAPE